MCKDFLNCDIKRKWTTSSIKSRSTPKTSSQAGLRADGAGESALPAEESPWRLRALSRERELWEFYKKTASISSREREKRITLLAVVLILWPPPEWPPDFPAPKRWSRGRRRGGPCVALLPYHSTWARERGDRMTWGAPPYVLFRPSTSCSSRPSC